MSCECELRQRAWNPNTQICGTCGGRFADARSIAPRSPWAEVHAYVARIRAEGTLGSDAALTRMLDDLRACERSDEEALSLERVRSSVHLFDAYRRMLDSCAHLMSDLLGHGLDNAAVVTEEAVPDASLRWHLRDVQQLHSGQVRAAVTLRVMIDDLLRRGEGSLS